MDAYEKLLSELEAERAKLDHQADDLLEAAAARPDASLTDDEQKIFDSITDPRVGLIAKLDKRVENLKLRQKASAERAKPVQPTRLNASGEAVAKVQPVKRYPKGCFFAAWAHALYVNNGNTHSAAQYARTSMDDHLLAWALEQPKGAIERDLDRYLEAATVARGTTADATFAAPLVEINQNAGEFRELLRPMTVIGRIPGVRAVSFDGAGSLKVKGQSSGIGGAWIGEGLPIQIERLGFDVITMTPKKLGVIVVETNEVLRRATPALLELTRDDMLQGAARTMDIRFVTTTAADSVTPPGIFNGGTTNAGGGLLTLAAMDADIQACITALNVANIPNEDRCWIMTETGVVNLMFIRDGNGNTVYKDEVASGRLFGYPIVSSNNATANVLGLVAGRQVMKADELVPTIALSEEATLSMRSDPGVDLSIDAAAGPVSSMFQTDSTAIRMVLVTDWAKRYAAASHRRTNVGWI